LQLFLIPGRQNEGRMGKHKVLIPEEQVFRLGTYIAHPEFPQIIGDRYECAAKAVLSN
jgi:hypothetical protein